MIYIVLLLLLLLNAYNVSSINSISNNILDDINNKVYGINVKFPYKNELLLEYVYQIPPSKAIKGVVFLAHGCSHSGTDWFDKDEIGCPACIGLPVEKTIVTKALKNDYVVIAMTSTNRKHKCWSHVDIEPSSYVLKDLFNKLYTTNILPKNTMVPIHLLGASSGGSYVGMMAMNMARYGFKISSICVQIMVLRGENPSSKLHSPLPPTLYIHMIKDEHISSLIHDSIVRLQHEKIPVEELQIKSKAITSTFFYDHGKVLSLEDSKKLHFALIENQYIDKTSHELLNDPRQSDWRTIVFKTLPSNEDKLIADLSPISELFNVAYAQHEITDEYLNETFDFFKKYT